MSKELDERIFSGETNNSKGESVSEKRREENKSEATERKEKKVEESKKVQRELRGMDYYEQVYQPSKAQLKEK